MIEYMKRGPFDELHTPAEATDFLVPYLLELDTEDSFRPILWESASPKRGKSKLATRLEYHGFKTLEIKRNTGYDFFESSIISYDVQVTNPPYSMKLKWLERTAKLGKPAALLLPVTVIGVGQAHDFVTNCRVILLPKRIDFTGKGAPWFSVAWFLWEWPKGRPRLEKGY